MARKRSIPVESESVPKDKFVEKSSKGHGVELQSEEAKAKAEKDYASHPKFAKFNREGK